MTIRKIAWGKYEFTQNCHSVTVEYSRNARYDTFDGKYHPGWIVSGNGKSHVCINKKAAFIQANKMF